MAMSLRSARRDALWGSRCQTAGAKACSRGRVRGVSVPPVAHEGGGCVLEHPTAVRGSHGPVWGEQPAAFEFMGAGAFDAVGDRERFVAGKLHATTMDHATQVSVTVVGGCGVEVGFIGGDLDVNWSCPAADAEDVPDFA